MSSHTAHSVFRHTLLSRRDIVTVCIVVVALELLIFLVPHFVPAASSLVLIGAPWIAFGFGCRWVISGRKKRRELALRFERLQQGVLSCQVCSYPASNVGHPCTECGTPVQLRTVDYVPNCDAIPELAAFADPREAVLAFDAAVTRYGWLIRNRMMLTAVATLSVGIGLALAVEGVIIVALSAFLIVVTPFAVVAWIQGKVRRHVAASLQATAKGATSSSPPTPAFRLD